MKIRKYHSAAAILLVALLLLASCATRQTAEPEAETVAETPAEEQVPETYQEAATMEIPAETAEDAEPAESGYEAGVIIEVVEPESILPIGDEPEPYEEPAEAAAPDDIIAEDGTDVAELPETGEAAETESAEAVRPEVVEYAGPQTRVSGTDAGDIMLMTQGTLTSFTFPAGIGYGDLEGVVYKVMDIFPQTAFTFDSRLSMIAPENFVRDNWDSLDFILKAWFEKEELPEVQETAVVLEVVAEPETETEYREPEAVDVLPPVENLNIPKPEEKIGEKADEPAPSLNEKAKGLVDGVAEKAGLEPDMLMLIVAGALLLVFLIVLIVTIRRRKRKR